MMIWDRLFLSVIALVSAGEAQAQARTHLLQDGRTIIVPAETAVCRVPVSTSDPRFAISDGLECRDAISGVEGTGYVLVGHAGGETTPREYLASVAAEMFPDATPAEKASQIRPVQTRFSGGTFEMLCVAGRDGGGTFGAATCVLSQPRTQVVVNGHSTGVEEAFGVIAMFLSGVTIRP